MFTDFTEISWLAVLAATLASAVLGALYFLALVPKQYLYVTGRENLPKEQQAVAGALFVAGPILCSLVTVVADAYLLRLTGITTVYAGAGLGLFVGTGFLTPMVFNIAINPLFPRPIQYGLLNAPFFIISSVVSCVILTAMPQ